MDIGKPFQSLTRGNENARTTPEHCDEVADQLPALEPQPPLSERYHVLYRRANRSRRANWEGDGVLSVRGSRIELRDQDSGDLLGTSTRSRPVAVGCKIFVAGRCVEVQELVGEMDGEPTSPGDTDVSSGVNISTAAQKRFIKLAIVEPAPKLTYIPDLIETSENADARTCIRCSRTEMHCDYHTPCENCIHSDAKYCGYYNANFTKLTRYIIDPNELGEEGMDACLHCDEIGRSCSEHFPCALCLEMGRKHCIKLVGNGVVETISCDGYVLSVQDDQSEIAVVPREGYVGEPGGQWPAPRRQVSRHPHQY